MDSRARRLRVAAPPPTARDDELLARVARGDQEAFAELYDRYASVVFGVIRRVLRDPTQSEEVAQEVLVEAWRIAARYDPDRGSVRTWLCTMAHRRAVDRVRSEQASRERIERIAHDQHNAEGDVVSDAVTSRLERQQVRDALGTLTDLQREAIELAYYGGHTYREVSELLGAPLGTVKTRMRDGLIRLRDAMGVSA
jgi:RNA polymerase sigma-70 factor (ECF subfamily)